MLRSILFSCALALAPLSATFAQQSSAPNAPAKDPAQPVDAWATPATPAPAPAAVAADPSAAMSPADSAAMGMSTATTATDESRSAGSSSLNATPRLNPNSSTSPYNKKAVKKSHELAVKVADKSKRRTYRNRDVIERQQERSIKQMRKGRR